MLKIRKSFPKGEEGFTLIEIIAVLILLGILAAVAIPKYMDLTAEARNKAAQGAIAEMKARASSAYGQYLLTHTGVAPTAVTDLAGISTDLGDDYAVTWSTWGTGTQATISVSQVQGVALSPAIIGTWTLPPTE